MSIMPEVHQLYDELLRRQESRRQLVASLPIDVVIELDRLIANEGQIRERLVTLGVYLKLTDEANTILETPQSWARIPKFEDSPDNEDEAYRVFCNIRWPASKGDARCPRCSGSGYAHTPRRIFTCRSCRAQFSVTTGTPFRSRKASFVSLVTALSMLKDDPAVTITDISACSGLTWKSAAAIAAIVDRWSVLVPRIDQPSSARWRRETARRHGLGPSSSSGDGDGSQREIAPSISN